MEKIKNILEKNLQDAENVNKIVEYFTERRGYNRDELELLEKVITSFEDIKVFYVVRIVYGFHLSYSYFRDDYDELQSKSSEFFSLIDNSLVLANFVKTTNFKTIGERYKKFLKENENFNLDNLCNVR